MLLNGRHQPPSPPPVSPIFILPRRFDDAAPVMARCSFQMIMTARREMLPPVSLGHDVGGLCQRPGAGDECRSPAGLSPIGRRTAFRSRPAAPRLALPLAAAFGEFAVASLGRSARMPAGLYMAARAAAFTAAFGRRFRALCAPL